MEKTYAPQSIETKWYQEWEQKNYFAPSGKGEPYSIMIPPPNVTGSLHMGHGFQASIMDALIRYKRMCGNNTLWQVGVDHAGIATQMVVERQLDAKGISRHDLGREKFVEKVWEWKEESGGNITRQLRRLGASADWSRERFTMDDGFYKGVQEVFIRLHEDGLIYRGKRLVNWDPKLHTAISDLEVLSEEEDGHLWHFKYPLTDGSGFLIVATTRPETMLGDTAVAVHPEDERYQHLIGKTITLPFTQRQIPIIADDYVEKDFGSGCVKITPGHDFNDYEMGLRHDLPVINVFDDDAKLNNSVPEQYKGMDRFDARKQIVSDLEAEGLLEKIEPHKLKIPRGDRSGVIIEPYLTYQWYVKTKPLAEEAIKAVEDGDIEFVPKNYENMYFSWMRDIQDWCISRQLWWGHRIPAWYDEDGKIFVGRSEEDVRKKHNISDNVTLKQDEDVLDTWFSSGLWTFGTLGWPENTPELTTFHPSNVLVTGFDIIFFWVARMIMLTLYFRKEIPFKTVYCTGMVRDSHGQKMSKSKGNVLDPIDMIDGIDLEDLVKKRTAGMMMPRLEQKIEKQTRKEFAGGIQAYGTDAMRFTFYSLASRSRDINFDVGRIEGYRNFCNKIWNASAYVLNNCEDFNASSTNANNIELSLADRWIQSRLQHVIKVVREGIDTYRFDLASQSLYDFVWNEFCSWYLELSKPVLTDESTSPEQRRGTQQTLINTLETILRLAHPLMPFITEELWQSVKAKAGVTGDTVMLAPYPMPDESNYDAIAESDLEWVKIFVTGIRNIRGEMQLSPNKELIVICKNASPEDQLRIENNKRFLCKLANIENLTLLYKNEEEPLSATALVGKMELLVPMAGLIDVAAESQRLQKEIDKFSKELARIEGKLSNSKFVDNAPEEVVAKEKAKAEDAKSAADRLRTQLEKMKTL
ncbi:MAG: valine--tRNA ligase [Cellvibrionaceae bacterium]